MFSKHNNPTRTTMRIPRSVMQTAGTDRASLAILQSMPYPPIVAPNTTAPAPTMSFSSHPEKLKPQPRFPSFRAVLFSFIPVVLWLLLFSSGVSLIPEKAKPPINVTLLPTIDATIFRRSHTWFENNGTRPTLDVLAAVPYTIHPTLPFVFLAASATTAVTRAAIPRFVLAFGTMNLAAVCTHLAFPTAPPWYFIKHGFKKANYSMKGDPAVLGRVDRRFNITMFHKMYAEGGKVVFGAWPSLHAAWPYLMARFKPGFGRRVTPLMWAYVILVWWAAIYLQHHYAVDILGGVLYAEGANMLVKASDKKPKEELLPFFVKPDIIKQDPW